ncbi:hypothetical protein LIER_36087 [Lithospermum erythrorhizon]|uniref:Uncharacterized protein n=1 Tax=Lithospermum erythrorhizon TaxID=34254 RepID=A0AAV3P5D5_LITER
MAGQGGKVELFNYCDADIFELGSIDGWAFRVGLRYGEFAACVYKHHEIEGLNGLFPLKSGNNVTHFVVLIENVKFIDVYFVKPSNNDSLIDMEDEYGNMKLSDWSIEIIKAKADEIAKLSATSGSVGVVEFNLEDRDNDNDSDTGDVEENEENVKNA